MINLSSPLKHLIVGAIGGAGICVISHNIMLSAGFFFGSWLIMDIDHILAYWRAVKFSLPQMVNIKEFFEWNKKISKRFLERPHLCWLPLHTIEFFVLWMCLIQFLFGLGALSAYLFCINAFAAMVIHFIMDRLELRLRTFSANKYCHSAIEYWWRKNINKEATYEDVWEK